MIIIFSILLFFLITLFLLFVFNCFLSVKISENSLLIYLFKIPIFKKKNQEFHDFIVKIIPKNKTTLSYDLDLASLNQYLHFDYLSIDLDIASLTHPTFIAVNSLASSLNAIFMDKITKKIKRYRYKITYRNVNHLSIKLKVHFNIGTILINYLLIRSNYVKTTH